MGAASPSIVDVAGVVEGVDEPIGDEFMVEDEGRRPGFVGESSPCLSFAIADALLVLLESLFRKEGIAVMLLWLWNTGRGYQRIHATRGSRNVGAEEL